MKDKPRTGRKTKSKTTMYVLVAIVAAVLVGSFALAASKIPASNPALSSSSSQSSNNTGTRNLSLASLIASGSAYKGGD